MSERLQSAATRSEVNLRQAAGRSVHPEKAGETDLFGLWASALRPKDPECVTNAAAAGGSETGLMTRAGHSDFATTKLTHLAGEQFRKKAELLERPSAWRSEGATQREPSRPRSSRRKR